MLGAQALRTKQKAERKEKEKRHRERIRSIELQRNQIHRAACEDAAAQFMEITSQPSNKVRSLSMSKNHGDDVIIVSTKHRHSVHSGAVPHLQVRMTHRNSSSNGSTERFDIDPNDMGPQRSTSSDYCRVDKKVNTAERLARHQSQSRPDQNAVSSTTRLLKWLGISDSDKKDESQKPISKRRMSTFT